MEQLGIDCPSLTTIQLGKYACRGNISSTVVMKSIAFDFLPFKTFLFFIHLLDKETTLRTSYHFKCTVGTELEF